MNRNIVPTVLAVVLAALIAFAVGRAGAKSGEHSRADHENSSAQWTCSMHPEISLPQKGNCPICGMELILKGKAAVVSSDESVLSLTPRELLRLDPAADTVRSGSIESSAVRLFGAVEPDPSQEKVVVSRVEGRIETFFGAVPGTVVKKGDPIAVIYSAQLYQLVQELKSVMNDSGSGASIAESSKKQFELLGFSEAEISKILADPSGGRRVTVRADRSGTVIESMVREGMQVMMGEPLIKIADLSRVTAVIQLYEKDFSLVRAGTAVTLQAESVPGKEFHSVIVSVDPVIDPMTRSARARASIPAGSGLIPGMSLSAQITGAKQEMLTIPASAPLITGTRALVYVEKSRSDTGAVFEAREIVLGPKTGVRYGVLSGLSAGEKVVVRGAFLLDSELQLRGGSSLLSPKRDISTAKAKSTAEPKAKNDSPKRLSVIPFYLPLWNALASDNYEASLKAWNTLSSKRNGFSAASAEILNGPAPKDMESMRAAFAKLSSAVIESKEPLVNGAKRAFCPMAFGSGASWIQTGDTIANPYYGSKMLRCGSFTGGAQ